MLNNIRNFAIIAHIDHGKSTLADRFLELTGTVSKEKLIPQMLDQNPIERERGITIKLQPVRMHYTLNAMPYTINLIDTPGHVDFSYEVSRSLAAVEGTILLVDATQGIQAETLAKLELSRKQGLAIIGAVNKIDLFIPDIEDRVKEVADLISVDTREIFKISGKTGQGVEELLNAVIARIPPPAGSAAAVSRALVFDSLFDPFRGVIAFVRVVDGEIKKGQRLKLFHKNHNFEVLEVGYFKPEQAAVDSLRTGEIGYVATGIKEAGVVRVGETITAAANRIAHSAKRTDNSESDLRLAISALPGYEEPQPLVFASVYPPDADLFPKLRESLERLRLNDAALTFEPEPRSPEVISGRAGREAARLPAQSSSLGRGFRVGALGMLHLEIIEERLQREFKLKPTVASPSVVVEVEDKKGEKQRISSPEKLPEWHAISKIYEPWVALEVFVPSSFLGALMKFFGTLTHVSLSVEAVSGERTRVGLAIPFRLFLEGLSDNLKSISSGFASFSYRFIGFRESSLVRLDVAVAGEIEPSLASLVPADAAVSRSRTLLTKLKKLIPRKLFQISLQAVVEGRIVMRENIPALKKDVTGYLYGGDITRKRKLWQKQKAGKSRLKAGGKVRISPQVFRSLFSG